MTDSTKPYAFNPSNIPTPPPTYKHVAITPLTASSKLVTLAGQVGKDADTGKVPQSFVEQVRYAHTNLLRALEAAGATPRDIIHVRHYLVKETGQAELDQRDIFDRGLGPIWIEFMEKHADGHLPPDTLLGVAALAEKSLLYEVEAWAIVQQ